MRPANDNETPTRLPGVAWLAVLLMSAAMLTYGTLVILDLTGLR